VITVDTSVIGANCLQSGDRIDQEIHNILLNVLDLENEVVYIAINTQT
jgi:hypothetical protein